MGFYSDRIVPILTDLSMRNRELRPYRERIVGAAEGRVLEIGVGSGRNLFLYPARVQRVIGIDPSRKLLAMARESRSTSARVRFSTSDLVSMRTTLMIFWASAFRSSVT